MQVVISIHEDYYKAIKEISDNQCTVDMLIIKNGTPLPKGHGRLIDADTLRQQWVFGKAEKEEIDNAPTIIEAERGYRMTLDEAIEIEETKVRSYNDMLASLEKNTLNDMLEVKRSNIEKLMNYHRQLAEWLRELKKYRAIFVKVGKILADNGYTMDDLDTIFGKVNGEVNADEDSD